jgi:hypothetical protein
MSSKTRKDHHEPFGSLPDISQLVTARLKHRQPQAETPAHRIAHHEAEIRRLVELMAVLEQAITALVIRLHMTADHGLREALAHNRADLQRFKDELASLQMEHQYAIERLQPQK